MKFRLEMREIKFRAWFKGQEPFEESWEKPRMIYEVQGLYDGSIAHLGSYGSFGALLDNENFAVMQFTGLRDKNGREIYEGDIVKAKGPTGYWNNWPVTFEHASFILGDDSSGCTFGSRDWKEGLEVIGNTHENPELLK